MTGIDTEKMRRAFKGAGLNNVDAALLITACETGSDELVKRVFDRHLERLHAAEYEEKKHAKQTEESEIDELEALSRQMSAALADPARPDLAPTIDREELREILRASKEKENIQEIGGNTLKALEQEIAESMRQPGQPLEELY